MSANLPRLITSLPGPRAQAVIARDHAVLSPSYTRPYPFVMARGEGAIVEDVDGNRFLDCNAGIAVVATGHAHPQGSQSGAGAGRQIPAHVRDGFLLRKHGRSRGEARVPGARAAEHDASTSATQGLRRSRPR